MDLIQKATELGFVLKNKEYFLWEIQKWLRETKGLYLSVIKKKGLGFDGDIRRLDNEGDYKQIYMVTNHLCSYEEALEKGLQEALKLI